MSRLTLLTMFLVSTSVFGQEFVVPKPDDSNQENRASIRQSPSTFQPVQEELPAAKPQPTKIQEKSFTVQSTPKPQLKADTQVYSSVHRDSSYPSQYMIEVARERAKARRMRMEIKKFYGIDTARPTVRPQGNLSTYSAYYNGYFSRPHYRTPYSSHYYFYQPVNR